MYWIPTNILKINDLINNFWKMCWREKDSSFPDKNINCEVLYNMLNQNKLNNF